MYSITVTSVPKRAYTDPSSRPITPPPITTIDFGSLARERASVEVIIRFLSISINGSVLGFEPVAMMTCFAAKL